MIRITDTVKHLLIINVLFFIASYLSPVFYDWFALYFPKNPDFHVWQLVTHMFMHATVEHIFFNMFGLYLFGSLIEQYLGRNKFLFLYFVSGFGAVGLQILFSYVEYNAAYDQLVQAGASAQEIQGLIDKIVDSGNRNFILSNYPQASAEFVSTYFGSMVGASGAIFGVMAAAAVIYPNLPMYLMFIPVPIKAKYLIGGYFAINVYSALTGSSIAGPANTAYWAHIGGAVIGFITMWYWKKNEFNNNRWN